MNQDETGIDCGGSCKPCKIVDITGNCSDGIRNQGELGIDCGGPCPVCNVTTNATLISELIQPEEVETGGSFTAKAILRSIDYEIGDLVIRLYLPEGFETEDFVVRDIDKLSGGEIETLTWDIDVPESVEAKKHLVYFEVFWKKGNLTLGGGQRYIEVKKKEAAPIRVIRNVQRRVYDSIDTVYNVVTSRSALWFALILVLIGLLYIYYMGRKPKIKELDIDAGDKKLNLRIEVSR